MSENQFRAGYVAIIGKPNVGKSTLLNSLLGTKLSIVTPKPQTTRHRISGILSAEAENYQIVFIDTPGVIEPKYRLHQYMVKTAFNAASDSDLIIFMIDATEPQEKIDQKIATQIKPLNKPKIMAINKIDLIDKRVLLPVIDFYKQMNQFDDFIPTAATKGDGLQILKAEIVKRLKISPPLFPMDQISDLPERFFAAETIREKIFLKTRQEIPYCSSVLIEEFKERENGKVYIRAAIFVERDGQKSILIGQKGQTLKEIGKLAREEVEAFLGNSVYLELWVVVREDWRDKDRELRELGYI